MRPSLIALPALALLLAVPAGAADSWSELMKDKATANKLEDGIKIMKEDFKAEAGLDKERLSQRDKERFRRDRDEAEAAFLAYLASSEQNVGINLAARPDLVMELLDQARVPQLATPKNGIDYIQVSGTNQIARGTLEYAVMCPESYKKNGDVRFPLVVSLHERVINPKHPAFRGSAGFEQRSRQTLYNNWLKTPGADVAVIVAPTGKPNGFRYAPDEAFVERQKLFHTLRAGLSDYRTDWDRVFLEVHGAAIKLLCEQALLFAGGIVREREDDRAEPILPADQYFLLENLNGLPLIYIADKANWNTVGKPLADELTRVYQETFKAPEKLLIMQSDRGPNGELPGDPAKIAEFLTKNKRPEARADFHWRYATPDQTGPVPVEVTRPDFTFDKSQPLSVTAGSIHFRCSVASEPDAEGKTVAFNKIDLDITQAEGVRLRLHEHLIDFDLPVTVVVNGKTLVDKEKLTRDWSIFCDEVLPARFFMLPIVANLDVAFELKPQYEAPKPPPEEATPPAEGETPAEGAPVEGDKGTGTTDTDGNPEKKDGD